MPSQQQVSNTPIEERDEFRSPKYAFRWAEWQWGRITIDLASTTHNRLTERSYTKENDAFRHNWSRYDGRGWCNPPYSDMDRWLHKAVAEAHRGFETIFLIPTPNGDKRDSLIFKFASEIVFIAGRLPFIQPNGREKRGNTRGSCLIHFAAYPQNRKMNRDDIFCWCIKRNDMILQAEKYLPRP